MIQINNISKKYEEKVIFEKFSLEIPDGDFVVFAGKSGCGKTTLLNMIGALERTTSGTILIDGKDISNRKYQKEYFMNKVGFLFQNFALIENKTVRQNLELVQKKARTNLSIEDVLENVDLKDKINNKIYKLSGGEQQRIALARLMLKKCDIILADEPTGSLDKDNARQVLRLLHRLNEQGKTVIVVTHDEEIINSEKRVIKL